MKRFSISTVTALFVLALTAFMTSCGGGGGGGSAAVPPSVTDTTAPTVPTSLTASAISANQIDLSWAASTDDTGVSGYEVWQDGTKIATALTTTYSAAGLASSISYTYTVKAFDSAGNVSAASSPAAATTLAATAADTTAPTIPSGLTTTVTSSSQIGLAWSASTDSVGVSGYKVYRGGTYLKSVATISTLDSGLTASTQYCYQVSAYDAANNESALSPQSCAITSAATTTAASGAGFKMPDTNQTTSYTFTFGEDGDYTINPPSYTDNGVTVTDNVTGLVWQKQDDAVGRSRADASTYCDNLSLGGYADWRLPCRMELVSLIDNGVYNPAINTTYFPKNPSAYSYNYWSATPFADNTSFAWSVNFDGVSDYTTEGFMYRARCVRGGQPTIQSLTNNHDDTVTDNGTRLMWQQPESISMTWEDALTYCEGLALSGYTDWRLPNHKELVSLVDDTRTYPSINTTVFPTTYSAFYWSSTTNAVNSAFGWDVYFGIGKSHNYYDKTFKGYARCVRGGL